MRKVGLIWFIFILILISGCEKENNINGVSSDLKQQNTYYVCPDSSIVVNDLDLCPKERVLTFSKQLDSLEKNSQKEKSEISSNSSISNSEEDINEGTNEEKKEVDNEECMYVGSKNSDKYHYPSCTWAKKIKPENLVCFKSKKEAEDKGYKPCSFCKPGS